MAGEARLECRGAPAALPWQKEGGPRPGPPGPRPPCAIEKAPPMSGTPYPPTDFLRSTFGEEGINFRVRNGIG